MGLPANDRQIPLNFVHPRTTKARERCLAAPAIFHHPPTVSLDRLGVRPVSNCVDHAGNVGTFSSARVSTCADPAGNVGTGADASSHTSASASSGDRDTFARR